MKWITRALILALVVAPGGCREKGDELTIEFRLAETQPADGAQTSLVSLS